MIKRSRQLACNPMKKFLEEAKADWDDYCTLLSEKIDDSDQPTPAPPYPFSTQFIQKIILLNNADGQAVAERRTSRSPSPPPPEGGS